MSRVDCTRPARPLSSILHKLFYHLWVKVENVELCCVECWSASYFERTLCVLVRVMHQIATSRQQSPRSLQFGEKLLNLEMSGLPVRRSDGFLMLPLQCSRGLCGV